MSARIKILTIVYVAVLAGIIYLANFKGTKYLVSFVGNIKYGDKIGHFVLFGILAFLLNLSFNLCSTGFGKIRYLTGSLVVLGIVTLEELSQIFIRSRTFDTNDLVFDFLGIVFFGEMARFVHQRRKRQIPGKI